MRAHPFPFLMAVVALLVVACTGPTGGLTSPEPLSDSDATSLEESRLAGTLTVPFGPGAKAYDYELALPEHWRGSYRLEQEAESRIVLLYSPAPETSEQLLSVEALTEEAWATRREEPGAGIELFSQDGVVFIAQSSTDNPFSGAQAEEFAALLADLPGILQQLTITRAE